ncbi:TetR/AcrR family transcriptional regulator [Clostridium saccharoperbutylacetonicum]|uniref:TetR/AcrR family transcriptional regulator n=1 Tax=Clostridium saccharoperbutylacetonicum TaxID=36745 RepID=UPI000983FF6E|nr:TetR/AcrR family transcriptional regulator [Clostridium saccharoperbutylacetonicum]AQR93452.1 tetracycline repressor protein class G [Clostridium saccharoperbutylacetonicum]NSB29150.1 AcrR family transcriptional regulator [Clostridium saccharoperbutylacetonicum]
MEIKKYHHGDLKESLIKMGLKLYNEEGADKFSIRKVAALCNVSHAAPYKHFKNKEELIDAISEYVFNNFQSSLTEIVENYKADPYERLIALGKRYVSFMVENPDYLQFAFLKKSDSNIVVEEKKLNNVNHRSFNVFKECAVDFLRSIDVKEEEYAQNIIAMWSMVHGLSTMLAYKTFVYEGNYIELVENILRNNLKF